MSFGACKPSTPSLMHCSAVIYAIASCVNLREELLALQASMPMLKTAIVGGLTILSRLVLHDASGLFARKPPLFS